METKSIIIWQCVNNFRCVVHTCSGQLTLLQTTEQKVWLLREHKKKQLTLDNHFLKQAAC